MNKVPEQISGNIFIRPNYLETVGEKVDGHKHNFDHTTYIIKGSVHVKAVMPDGSQKEKDFGPGEWFLVRAGTEHEIVALEADTFFHCIYAHRDPQGRITQVNTGWDRAYE
jgi:quercetin dioxygenase-like cupin family protein